MTLTTVPVMSVHGQYAIAQARAIIHDGGVADLVDLQFDAGFWRLARIAPEWLRLGKALSDTWRVTLYFRTGADGRLKEMPYITTIRSVEDHDPVFSWSAVGRVVQFDSGSGWVTFRVRPDAPAIKPFLLRAIVPPVLMDMVIGDRQLRLTGTLWDERLLVEQIDLIEAHE